MRLAVLCRLSARALPWLVALVSLYPDVAHGIPLTPRRTSPGDDMQFMDDELEFGRLDFIKLASVDGVRDLLRSGYVYGQRTDAVGGFDPVLGGQRKWLITRAVEFPVRQIGHALQGVLSPAA